tara:strand:- start:132 stop:755 length:624 start_codon:yes stop_codon:yes gene_type:complete
LFGVGGGGRKGVEDDDKLAFNGAILKGIGDGSRVPVEQFFVFFGELAGNEELTIRAEVLFDFGHEFEKAVGRFVENNGEGMVGPAGEFALAASAFGRKKADEGEPGMGEAAAGEGGGEGGGTGDGGDGELGLLTGLNEADAGVGDGGHAGVGNEGNRLPFLDALDDGLGALGFVEFVIAGERGLDVVALGEALRVAGVFGADEVDLL